MIRRRTLAGWIVGAVVVVLALPELAAAQRGGPKGPVVVSPEIKPLVVFRVLAPKASSVSVISGDMPGGGKPRPMTKGDNGVWEVTVGPVDPGTYRYLINVDGVQFVDPRNPAVSVSNGNAWSVIHVPGADFMDTKDVPHGAVAAAHYRSSALGKNRQMHVYTPPGYEAGTEKYPVFYLLHGAGDSDDSWTSVGRANFILDNLIAAGKARPMIVVMPAGHTDRLGFGMKGKGGFGSARFEQDFIKDIVPYIEKHYRVLTSRADRAIAGLSMGGAQTLNIMAERPQDFGYVGVFSSAVLFGKTDDWEKQHPALNDAAVRKELKLLWFATGKDDFLIQRTRDTVALFKNHGFEPVFQETDGGHTWINWRLYLKEFAPQLFR